MTPTIPVWNIAHNRIITYREIEAGRIRGNVPFAPFDWITGEKVSFNN